MNAERRKQIDAIIERLNAVQNETESILAEIEGVQADEQEYYDNMPEAMQGGEKGDRASEAVDALTEAADGISNFDVAEIIGLLETAKG